MKILVTFVLESDDPAQLANHLTSAMRDAALLAGKGRVEVRLRSVLKDPHQSPPRQPKSVSLFP
jgi:hypothetical protein